MTDLDSMDIVVKLAWRQSLFELLRIELDSEPRDEAGIKLCDEQIKKLEKQIDDIIMNGTGDKDKEPLGVLNFKGGT